MGRESTYITSIFRRSSLEIAFRINNNIRNLWMHKNRNPDKFSFPGVYKLTCPDCKKAYVGQTGRSFAMRYNVHEHAFRNNNHTSRFAHLIEHVHSFGTFNNTMQRLHYHKKGAHHNTVERYYIYAEYTANNHLNDNIPYFSTWPWSPPKYPPAITSPPPPLPGSTPRQKP